MKRMRFNDKGETIIEDLTEEEIAQIHSDVCVEEIIEEDQEEKLKRLLAEAQEIIDARKPK